MFGKFCKVFLRCHLVEAVDTSGHFVCYNGVSFHVKTCKWSRNPTVDHRNVNQHSFQLPLCDIRCGQSSNECVSSSWAWVGPRRPSPSRLFRGDSHKLGAAAARRDVIVSYINEMIVTFRSIIISGYLNTPLMECHVVHCVTRRFYRDSTHLHATVNMPSWELTSGLNNYATSADLDFISSSISRTSNPSPRTTCSFSFTTNSLQIYDLLLHPLFSLLSFCPQNIDNCRT